MERKNIIWPLVSFIILIAFLGIIYLSIHDRESLKFKRSLENLIQTIQN